ncbi:helix-turn-helix domain-containing protein [Nocardioides nanhaiensis]|uniref:Helix-turn-helix domain-containing protein n=1 Tax=Nocardioides nanhaiensis TaxID=1476871 RepID=A0ABP8WDD0_9ACTN
MRAQTREFLAEHRRARVVPIAHHLVDVIVEENRGYRDLPVVTRADLLRSCLANVARLLELLAEAADTGRLRDGGDPAYDAARETGQRRAEQGFPLDDVLRSFRMGGRLIWADLVAQAPAVLDSADVLDIGTALWEVVDRTSAEVATSYHRHERAAVDADAQQRAELWEGLLTGRAREPAFAHLAARVLDLPVSGDYLVVSGTELELLRAERSTGAAASRWVRRTDGVVGLVALRESDPAPVLRALAHEAEASGCVLGVSTVVAGLSRVDDGVGQAQLALRARDGRPGLATFDEQLPEALLLSSPVVTRRLVAVWLSPVLELGGSESGVLIDTLAAWVASGGSVTATATAVPCHRNTVMNRLRRVEGLLALPLLDRAPPVELALALRAVRLGPQP